MKYVVTVMKIEKTFTDIVIDAESPEHAADLAIGDSVILHYKSWAYDEYYAEDYVVKSIKCLTAK